jgi:hypothetical protein
MIGNQIGELKRGLKSTAAIAGWSSLAGIATGIAVLWFAAALFIFLADRYGALTASLSVGGCFVLLAAIAALAAFFIHRKRELERKAAAKAAANVSTTAWLEPALIAAGLDVARMIGGRRAVSLAAGAAAVVWLFNKANHDSARRRRTSARYPS